MAKRYTLDIQLYNEDHSLEDKMKNDFVFAVKKTEHGHAYIRLLFSMSEDYDIADLVDSIRSGQWEKTREADKDETLGEYENSKRYKLSHIKIVFMGNKVIEEQDAMIYRAFIEMPTDQGKDPQIAVDMVKLLTSYGEILA